MARQHALAGARLAEDKERRGGARHVLDLGQDGAHGGILTLEADVGAPPAMRRDSASSLSICVLARAFPRRAAPAKATPA